jgi:hypothetical protein
MAVAEQSVTLASVTNYHPTDTLLAGGAVTFLLQVTNTPGNGCAYNSTFNWRVYSPDGATWTNTLLRSNRALDRDQHDTLYFEEWSVTGSGADSVAVRCEWSGKTVTDTALYDGFDAVAFLITVFPTEVSDGLTICLDTIGTTAPAGFEWGWEGLDTCSNIVPTWDGPHCYTLTPCCGFPSGDIRGNIDCDPGGIVDIGDLTRLLDHLYYSRNYLCCSKAANLDLSADKRVNMGDVTRLIDFLYMTYTPPPTCE